MGTVFRLRAVGAVPTLALVCALVPAARAAVPDVACSAFDIGPDVSARPVAVCYGYRGAAATVSVSRDRGRTWSQKQPLGTPEPADHLFSVLVSPSYDTDRTIYLHYQMLGLFASTDDGATFRPADGQAGGERGDRVSRIDAFGPAVPGVAATPAVAIPGQGPGVFYRGQHLPVVGSGRQQDRGFYQLGHGPGAVVLNASQGPDETFAAITQVARCTAELTCPGGFAFPKRMVLRELAVDPATAASTAVALLELDGRPSVWVSTDGGGKFVRSAAFDKAVTRFLGTGFVAFIESVAVFPGGREWLVTLQTSEVSVLLATTDGGRTWSRRGYPSGTSRIVAGRDGRLYGSGRGVFRCSLDRGRTWHTRCPR